MGRIPAEMLSQIVQDGARGPHRDGVLAQAKTIQGAHLEVLAHRKLGRFRRKDPVLVTEENGKARLEQFLESGGFRGEDDFGRPQPFQFGQERGSALQLGGFEVSGGQVHHRQAVAFAVGIDRRQEIITLGLQHALVEVGAWAEDLGDLAFDELAGPGLLHLIADGDLAASPEDAGQVAPRGVIGNAAHGDHPPLGQGHVEQLGAGLGVLEEHLVEVAQSKKQQRVLGQFALDPAILRHHGRELGVVRHRGGKPGSGFRVGCGTMSGEW